MSKLTGMKRGAPTTSGKPAKKVKIESQAAKAPLRTKKAAQEDFSDNDDGSSIGDDSDSLDDEFNVNENKDEEEEEAGEEDHLPPRKSASNGKNIQSKTIKREEGGTSRTEKQDGFLKDGTSSREAHAEQKKLAQQRKAAKPNADSVYRSKKLWEKLRIKSNVPKEERKKLVAELFSIITGRVKDFVFKHDSVRVIQCALKYATPEQKKGIASELRGAYRDLAESKYAKFLVGRLVMIDNEVRNWVVEEFYGHVKRLIRHPEAGWIVDDIYRGIATKEQKARLLREWYGPEFVVMKTEGSPTADLSSILVSNPEKRGPIMTHLKELTNQLVQKKTTGFTMLHDALLQYFLNCKPGSPEHTEFLELLKDDEEGDLFKNLAFTKSGSRVVCLALAYGSAKDRRNILKFFKTHIKALAGDAYGCHVLLTAYEVIDDTVMTAKAIFPELLNKDMEQGPKEQELLAQATHLVARIPLLWHLSSSPPKWLITDAESSMLEEIKGIRQDTSKKDPEKRRTELVEASSQVLLDLIASQATTLSQSSFGCQFITEVLFGAMGEKESAVEAIVALTKQESEILDNASVGRMLKSLVQGGPFDKTTKKIVSVEPPLGFHDRLYEALHSDGEDKVVHWASGGNSFTILAMLESGTFSHHDALTATLKAHKSAINTHNAGGRLILEKIGSPALDKTGHSKPKSKRGSK